MGRNQDLILGKQHPHGDEPKMDPTQGALALYELNITMSSGLSTRSWPNKLKKDFQVYIKGWIHKEGSHSTKGRDRQKLVYKNPNSSTRPSTMDPNIPQANLLRVLQILDTWPNILQIL